MERDLQQQKPSISRNSLDIELSQKETLRGIRVQVALLITGNPTLK